MVTINGKQYKDYKYLHCVDLNANNNKFYEAFHNNDGSIDVIYGREGTTRTEHHYNSWEKNFGTLIQSKLNKGYHDITNTKIDKDDNTQQQNTQQQKKYDPVEDEKVQEFLDFLEQNRRDYIQNTYQASFTAKSVTKALVDGLRDLLDELLTEINNKAPAWRINNVLTEIFTIAPRKYLYEADINATHSDLMAIFQKEYNNYEVLKAQYDKNELDKKNLQSTQTQQKKGITLMDALGLKIRPVTFAEEDAIRKLLKFGDDKSRCFLSAYKVENHKTDVAFDGHKSKLRDNKNSSRLLFHGSGNENWASILSKGLIVNADRLGLASGTGKGLGNGLYFGDDIDKSFSYCNHDRDGKSVVGIYEVALGKCKEMNDYDVRQSDIDHNDSTFLDGKKYQRNKYKYHSGRNEYCIYSSEQCSVKYVLICQKEYVREKNMRYDIHTDFLFKKPNIKNGLIEEELRITDESKKALIKISNTNNINTAKMIYNIKDDKYTLYINDKTYNLNETEREHIAHDFMKSGWDSENAFKDFCKDYIEKAEKKVQTQEETKTEVKNETKTEAKLKVVTNIESQTDKELKSASEEVKKDNTTPDLSKVDNPSITATYDIQKVEVKEDDYDYDEILI